MTKYLYIGLYLHKIALLYFFYLADPAKSFEWICYVICYDDP